ncbi:MAG: UvrD-helicase domain-containing protein [Dehalococcoidia bacterium]|nr:UvrD-helicase domain-containing protein [Dehalococcoidia bacterium]MDZ4245504.1 UvrD-helicase domain-containing protein [Dehalococcoidia bacterium]
MTVDLLAGLNTAQKEAVEAIEGPVLILAGPGSGKTRVITHRIANLVKVWRINPRRIMAVTFTNKAASEMKDRLSRMMGTMVDQLTLGTFHACCARILRMEGSHIGLDKNFVIYDDDDQLKLVKRVIEGLNLDPKKIVPRAILSGISAAKSQLITPQAYSGQVRSYFDEVVQRVYEKYSKVLISSRALDFDDLLMTTTQLFSQKPEVLSRYQSRYLHLLVDEFQDTNVAQYVLAKQLAGKHRNICVVGDPDQSIYSWRYADIRNILNFEKDYPDARIFYLERNYRSTKTILEAATSIISCNKQRKSKSLWTENELGAPITVSEMYDEKEEAQEVVKEIEKLTRNGKINLSNCAVMYRTNAQSRVLEETFMRFGMPYKLIGGTRFYERKEIKDTIAYLRLINNPYDSVSMTRIINVPGRGIGQQSFNRFTTWANEQGYSYYIALKELESLNTQVGEKQETPVLPIPLRAAAAFQKFIDTLEDLIDSSKKQNILQLFDDVLKRTGYKEYILGEDDGEERWENIMELRTVASDFEHLPAGEALVSFLEKVALVQDVDALDEKTEAVTLITLHKAKGLEYPVVFIIGMEERLFPHSRSYDDPAQMEEERRLCYVGVTRAEKHLYLFHTFRRTLMGMNNTSERSRFLDDIPPHLISTGSGGKPVETGKQKREGEITWETSQVLEPVLELNEGDRVLHEVFGQGIVQKLIPVQDDFEVMIKFHDGLGVKKLLLSLAPLEKLA